MSEIIRLREQLRVDKIELYKKLRELWEPINALEAKLKLKVLEAIPEGCWSDENFYCEVKDNPIGGKCVFPSSGPSVLGYEQRCIYCGDWADERK